MELSSLAVRSLAALLEQHTGQQLVSGRQWRVEAALKPILRDSGIASLESLVGQIAQQPRGPLAVATIEAMLNHETSFFRDLASFNQLTDDVIPMFAERRAAIRRLRIWSAGCSTGQEAYSMALRVHADPARWQGWSVSIIGSDVSHAAIERARQGLYSQLEIQRGLPVREMMLHFDMEGEQWRARPELRARINFIQHNLLDPPIATGIDVILCRNVLLYFDVNNSRRLLDRFAEALAPDGLLMLGAGETVIGLTDKFVACRERRGFYALKTDRG